MGIGTQGHHRSKGAQCSAVSRIFVCGVPSRAGDLSGEVQIWDPEESTKIRSMHSHTSRVGVMSWNKHILSTGSRSGEIINHDVRIADHKVASLMSHTSEVCGLEWRADGAQLDELDSTTRRNSREPCSWPTKL